MRVNTSVYVVRENQAQSKYCRVEGGRREPSTGVMGACFPPQRGFSQLYPHKAPFDFVREK
jgi:hypothetical protein